MTRLLYKPPNYSARTSHKVSLPLKNKPVDPGKVCSLQTTIKDTGDILNGVYDKLTEDKFMLSERQKKQPNRNYLG